MSLVSFETELTTAFTDLFMALICAVALVVMARSESFRLEKQRIAVWMGAFGCLGIAALLGFFAHGCEMQEETKEVLWHPLYLFLGLSVSLFAAGVVIDLKEKPVAGHVIAGLLAAGCCFYAVTIVFPDSFIVFILYEAAAMLFAQAAYVYLWIRNRKSIYLWMSAGIAVSILAAAIQATGSMSLTLIWTFDNNGLFHIVQMFGIFLLLKGLLPKRA